MKEYFIISSLEEPAITNKSRKHSLCNINTYKQPTIIQNLMTKK